MFRKLCWYSFLDILLHSVVPNLSVKVHPALQDLHFVAPYTGHSAKVDGMPFAQVHVFAANNNAFTQLHSRTCRVIQTGSHETYQYT